MNASNVLRRFGAFGNLPRGSAKVSSELWLMFGRKVCEYAACWGGCDKGEGWYVGGAGKDDNKEGGMISFCEGFKVVALLMVEMRFMFMFVVEWRRVGGSVTGGARLRRKRWNLENIVSVSRLSLGFYLIFGFWFGLGWERGEEI